MIGRALAIVLFGWLLLGASSALAASPQHWLVVSDIHFDPFSDSKIVERLNAVPAERWRSVFASAGAIPFSYYGSDTNYPLLESALEGMRNETDAPDVVIIAGDFIAHDFRKKFQATVRGRDERAYDAFVDKTILFLANEFRTAFPHAKFLPVVGNNDSYCGDYESEPHSPFLAHMAMAWQPSVSPADANAFISQFSIGGYYAVPLPIVNARAVVLNDVFWSRKYSNACGDKSADPGGDELAWLKNTIGNGLQRSPSWVIEHIPPGIDVFATLNESGANAGSVSMMLADRFNDGFLSIIGNPDANVAMAVAGHTHMDSFRVIGPNPSSPVAPMLVVPSISPIYANNPAFMTIDVDSASAAVNDVRVFVLDGLSALARDPKFPSKWRREYDFGSVFSHGTIDANRLLDVEQSMFGDGRLQLRFEQFYDSQSGRAPIVDSTWRSYWCGNIALTATAYIACAMPQIQHSLPPQPTAPPTPAPAASPRPTGSP